MDQEWYDDKKLEINRGVRVVLVSFIWPVFFLFWGARIVRGIVKRGAKRKVE